MGTERSLKQKISIRVILVLFFLFSFALSATVLFFCLDAKETKNQGCIFFAKIERLVSEGGETRFAQTAPPSFRYNPPDFFTQKK